jgi:hypothetical protein
MSEMDAIFQRIKHDQLRRLEWLYEALSRAECRRQGIDPDDVIADGGHLAWHLVGYEAAVKEMPEPEDRTRQLQNAKHSSGIPSDSVRK